MKKLPSLIVLVGLLFVLFHPFQHAVEIALLDHDSIHKESPHDNEDHANEFDCIECILVSSLSTDFVESEATFLFKSDYFTSMQSNFQYIKYSDFEFSLRAPPVFNA